MTEDTRIADLEAAVEALKDEILELRSWIQSPQTFLPGGMKNQFKD